MKTPTQVLKEIQQKLLEDIYAEETEVLKLMLKDIEGVKYVVVSGGAAAFIENIVVTFDYCEPCQNATAVKSLVAYYQSLEKPYILAKKKVPTDCFEYISTDRIDRELKTTSRYCQLDKQKLIDVIGKQIQFEEERERLGIPYTPRIPMQESYDSEPESPQKETA
jgi:hypothetical protein